MADSVLTYLDTYCERAGEVGALAEPLNLVTNLFFVVAAVLVIRTLRYGVGEGRRLDLWLLAFLMASIGVGSGLWHLVPTQTTLLMDVVPIGLFINVFLISALRRAFGLRWAYVLGWWLLYTALGIVAQKLLPPDLLNGTVMYLPTYGALVVMTALLWFKNRVASKGFLTALVMWTASLFFRTVDMESCQTFAIGTHFLWHTLNAWVLWRLTLVLIRGR